MNKPFTQWSGADFLEFFKSVDKKAWIKAGILLVVLGALIYFIGVPAWSKRPEIRQQISSLKSQILTVQTLQIKRPELENQKREAQGIIDNAKARIFKSGETSLLLGAISKLAQESGVSIIKSRPESYEASFPEPFDQQYEGGLYHVTVEGGYHALGQFASRLESYPKLLRVQHFNIQPNSENVELHTADVTLSAVSFKEAL